MPLTPHKKDTVKKAALFLVFLATVFGPLLMSETFHRTVHILKPFILYIAPFNTATDWLRLGISLWILSLWVACYIAILWYQPTVWRLSPGYKYNPKGAVIRNPKGEALCTKCFLEKKEEYPLKTNNLKKGEQKPLLECPVCGKEYDEWDKPKQAPSV